jgi:hypothetical protein
MFGQGWPDGVDLGAGVVVEGVVVEGVVVEGVVVEGVVAVLGVDWVCVAPVAVLADP